MIGGDIDGIEKHRLGTAGQHVQHRPEGLGRVRGGQFGAQQRRRALFQFRAHGHAGQLDLRRLGGLGQALLDQDASDGDAVGLQRQPLQIGQPRGLEGAHGDG